MCGLAGIFHPDHATPIDETLLRRMTTALGASRAGRRRLPLSSRASASAIAGCRSSTSPAARQPMFNEDGSVVIVFNGEIYNFPELRPELQALGHVFRNRCDTEAIIHAWESWGPDCLQAAERHVRLRAVGPQAADPVPRARPARQEAAVLRSHDGRRAGVRLRARGADHGAGSEAADQPGGGRRFLRPRLRARPALDLRRHPQAAAGALPAAARKTRMPRRAATGRRRPRTRADRGGRGGQPARRAPGPLPPRCA